MLVRCLYNKSSDLPADLLEATGYNSRTDFGLTIGKHYIVYAITVRDNYLWYYIDDDYSYVYPVGEPAPLLSIVEGRMSRYWVCSYSIIVFPEWANDPYNFYDALTNGDEEEEEIFLRYKKLMDVEFPNPSITISATLLDTNWLMCPICIDAWETVSTEGMVICPKCHTMMHNPQYSREDISRLN
jgi:hypothetical protein